ncbi:ATP-binding protein [Stigmatella aurantiaca]|uniref:histidine kinase n=2 Tax=Stigmatella aurantiaca (strain DW4/3-1) TaxID=378806 RepID=E3FUL6_STIAD|nr:ATP-binding protein [Stigmatella aurantiaca]ADO74714.1 Sensor protein [Stigmatella aurantiaca DW4/3-1]
MGTSTTPHEAASSSSSATQLPGEPQGAAAALPAGGGEMGALMRSINWAQTPVGPLETWPQSLRTAVSILLESRFPMYIAWGPQFVQFYNDGFRPILGSTKHPGAMGRSSQSTFAEGWHLIGPMFEEVRQGKAVGSEDWMLPLDRNGYLEECYFTFSYSPIRDESGGVGGVHVTVTETTGRVLGERRLRTLRDLAARAGPVRREQDAWREAAQVLEGNVLDVPFALLYRMSDAGERPELVETAGWGTDTAAAVSLMGAPQANLLWPFADAAATLTPQFVPDVRARFAELPRGTWPEAPHSAWVLPISRSGSKRLHGFLVAGLSARRAPDDDYRGFLGLVADHIATAISSACAYEEEKKRAEALAEIDRTKTAFFNNVSHELRTPLALMLGPIEDGLEDTEYPLPPKQRERQEVVHRNGLRLRKLVNMLLDFARMEAGRAQASFVPTDLSALTIELASNFGSAMAAAGLAMVVDCPVLPEAVYVDPAMWEKVVLNLLSNALKFTLQGEVRIALRWLGDRVELTVQDTGTGMPEAELPRIFERFHRVEGARGRSHEGTGIGLALVQELVKLHGGSVTVKSVLGQGSTFTVSLPAGAAHLPQEHLGVPRMLPSTGSESRLFLAEASLWNPVPTPPAAPSPPLSEARILLADDNADMRIYLSRLLSPHWSVEPVSEGSLALAAARANPPSLIISDVMMPGVNGLELVQSLRADNRTRTIPILLLSARAGEEATIQGLNSGADEYLVKPFSAKELLARVTALLTVSQLRQAAVRAERAHVEDTLRFLEESRRATRLREDMLAVVSHDLRSPLTAIRTSAELLRRIPPEGEPLARVHKQADAIRRSADRMNRLIDDLLDLASIDAGTLSVQAHPQRVDELVRDARELFEPHAAEKGLQLAFEVEPGLILSCDKERILQALGNLLSNAIKFTPPGGSILLRAHAEEGTEDIRLSVADTGPGIPLAAQPHIFDRYWHGVQNKREGHGLGLSIAKGIVESHGGRIRLEKTSGEGSTFSFSLPSGQQKAGAVSPAHRPALLRPGAEESFIQGGGEMGALMRSIDWSKNSLGPVEAWPQSLRTSISTMLRSPYPIILFWGPELRMLYNDPFRPILGAKHPQTLGARGHEALAEEWALLGPLMKRVHETGEPLFIENGNVNFARRPGGLREEAYFTWSYNPTIGETGEIAGLFAIASETTRQVVGDRRLGILRELSIRAALDKTVEGVFRSLEEVLAQAGNDLPFALLYVVKAEKAHLVSCSGLERGAPAAPLELSLGDTDPWPLTHVASLRQEALAEDLHLKFGSLPGGPWPEPATRALVLPVPMGADTAGMGVLVAGLSPLVALDDEYRGFLQLLARQLAASISSARAYEQEKQRAEELALLDQAKTAFFSNVSHEFRTPLTLILGPVEDALSKPAKALTGEKLDLVRRNALRLYKMVNTLLDFSRMEAGRAQAHYVPVDLSAVTRNLASAFQSAVESAGLRLVVDCPPLPEPLYVDPEMWEKVVLNLLSNAVKYTYEGEIRVVLRWQDDHAVLTVQDTGVGIPEEELPRVFERFYRVRATQGRSHEGTGIGLALVQELMKLHGGSISVESTLGEGTAFTLRLPRGSAHLPPERIERTPRPGSFAPGAAPFVEEAQRWSADAAGTDRPSAEASDDLVLDLPEEIARSRILLVDDNADLRTYVAGLLGRIFPHVETATNGQDALERVRVQPPDLVLADVMMPGLDGFGLVRALRADKDTRAIPIILLSARAGDESTVEGLQSGADDYLVKPFSARELLVRVRTHLDMARVRREVVRNEIEKKVLRESVRVRDEFLNLVSHELRTPVSALSLNFQSLVRSLGREGGDEASLEAVGVKAQTTQKQLHRLARLVEQLLDASEFVTGCLKLARQEVDLSGVASAVVEQAQSKAAHAGCVLTLNAPSPVMGYCDRARLHQLLEGLLDNALKFGAGKPIEVAVWRDSDHALLTVMDHGAGIEPEDEERIFGRFERAVSEKNYGGFGLGLWISRHIAEAHDGSIRLRPTEGGGATFTVALPLNETVG